MKRCFKLLIVLIISLTTQMLCTASFASNKPEVLVSIKPIHSLVASIMQGVAEPALLMKSNQSLHHYNMRPSERRMISKASLIFWIGPQLEAFLPRTLQNTRVKAKNIALIETENLIKLSIKDQHHQESHQESQHPDSTEHYSASNHQTDPHIWLSTHNALVLTDEISRQLSAFDPSHKTQYEKNRDELIKKISQLKRQLEAQLFNHTEPYMTYHNAIRYFETEFKLNNIASIKPNSEVQPSALHIREITQTIKNKNIRCLFYNQPEQPSLISSLQKQSGATVFALDPVGIQIKAGGNAWFDIMQDVSNNLRACLNSE